MLKFLGMFLLFTASIFPQLFDTVSVSIFLSTNLNNSTVLSISETNTTFKSVPTFGAGVEIGSIKNEKFNKGGIGIEFQTNNSIPEIPGNYTSTPIYAFYDISLGDNISPYVPRLSFKLGYNVLSATNDFVDGSTIGKPNTSNGIFYALGISTQLNKSFLLRIMYSVNQGKVIISERNYLLNNEKITISLVLKIL